MRFRDEEGQAVLAVVLMSSIFIVGAVGLGVDGAHIYAQRQMAQTAADAAALAGIMSIFDGTNVAGSAGFTATTGTSFTCTTTDTKTPCAYAIKNGFPFSGDDQVTVDFPDDSAAPGVAFASDTVHLIRVKVQRNVKTTLIGFLGTSASTVRAQAIAAIVSVTSPTPILVTDPTNPDTLQMNGTTNITICGGPTRSIQVNSASASAFTGGGTIDLTHAGPADPGNCTTGTGGDFGVFGGSTTNPGSVSIGSTGHYLSKQSPILDPLANVSPPSSAGMSAGTSANIAKGVHGCTDNGGCVEYTPGTYASLAPGKKSVIFDPGIYYINGGGVDFKQTSGGGTNFNAMCVGCAADANTGSGMLIYDTGPLSGGFANTGGFNIGTQASLVLQGAVKTTHKAQGVNGCTAVGGCDVPGPPYYGILFWEDRNAKAQSHTFGQGNGCFSLVGTIYITNTLAIMKADSNHHQTVEYHGTPCSGTINQGEIIVSQLVLKGNVTVSMGIYPYGFLTIRQVALVG